MKHILKYLIPIAGYFLIAGFTPVSAQKWTLKQCLDTALSNNNTIKIQENNVAISEERIQEAKANLLPRINASIDYKYFIDLPYQLMPLSTFNPQAPEGQFLEAQFGVPHNTNANVTLAVPVYNPNIIGAISSSKILTEISKLQQKRTEEQVFFEISTLFYNAQILIHQIHYIDSNLINANRLLSNLELLHSQLLAKGTDVNKVKLQVEQLVTARENLQARLDQVINALKISMGIDLETSLEIVDVINFQESSQYAQSIPLEIQVSAMQADLLKTTIKTMQRSRYLPTINLIVNYGASALGYDKKPNDFLNIYPVGFAGLQINYPIFGGTVPTHKINQMRLELANNELQTKLYSQRSQMEISNARRQMEVALKTVRMTESQIALATSIYSQTILQQKQGTASLTDVLLADNAMREAQQSHLTAIVDYLKADLNLKNLTGNITTSNQ